MTAIWKREFQSYFQSMIGYVIVAVIMVFIGIYFLAYNMLAGYPYFSYSLSSALVVLIFVVPVLTMRSFSEERKTRTDQLLLTAPISVGKIVVGKYLGMITVFAIPVLFSCLCPLVIMLHGTNYPKVDYATILAYFLVGSTYIAIGMFVSSLTESQVIAAVATIGILLLVQMWDGVVGLLPTSEIGSLIGCLILLTVMVLLIYNMNRNYIIAISVETIGILTLLLVYNLKNSLFSSLLPNLLGKLNFLKYFDNFAFNNIFDVTGVVFYVSVSMFFIFLTTQVLQKRRWS